VGHSQGKAGGLPPSVSAAGIFDLEAFLNSRTDISLIESGQIVGTEILSREDAACALAAMLTANARRACERYSPKHVRQVLVPLLNRVMAG